MDPVAVWVQRADGTCVVAADDARRSLELGRIVPAGNPQTVADGLRTTLGQLPWSIR